MVPRLLSCLVAALLLVSCGSATAVGGGHQIVAGDSDNGKTLQLRVGDRLQVRLASTYWTINEASDPSVLRSTGPMVISPQPSGCVPGAGCGFAIAGFEAVARGSSDVTATRTSCGEAMRCVGDAGFYRVSVAVAG